MFINFLRGWIKSFLSGIVWTLYIGLMLFGILLLWAETGQPGFDGVIHLFVYVFFLVILYALVLGPPVDGMVATLKYSAANHSGQRVPKK